MIGHCHCRTSLPHAAVPMGQWVPEKSAEETCNMFIADKIGDTTEMIHCMVFFTMLDGRAIYYQYFIQSRDN